MRGIDIHAKIRTVARATGCVITVSQVGDHLAVETTDPEDGKYHVVEFDGDAESALAQLHERIYKSRGEAAYRRQGGLCALCGEKMIRYEVDHIKTRAKGRDDRGENLRAVDPACHRERHSAL